MSSTSPDPKMSRLTKGYLIAIIGTAFWSSTAIFIRYLTTTHQMPALLLAFWRDSLVCVVLIIGFIFIKKSLLQIDRRNIPFFIIYGFTLATFNGLWTISVSLNGAAVSTVLAYSSAGFTVILGWWLFKEQLSWTKILAVLLSLSGCVLVAGAYDLSSWSANPLGLITGLLSGLLFAAYSLAGKISFHRAINPWSALFYSFLFASFFLLLFNFIPDMPGTPLPQRTIIPNLPVIGWLALFTLAAVPTIAGYGLYTVSLTYLPASIANLIATLEPAMTAIQAYVLLKEYLTLPQIIGAICIITGVIIVRLKDQLS
jgi:DME family drug/metabolite transporter